MNFREGLARIICEAEGNDFDRCGVSEAYTPVADSVIEFFKEKLLTLNWEGTEGSPGYDIRAITPMGTDYLVRHLSDNRFDVIHGTPRGSIRFKEEEGIEHKSYEEAKAFALQDYRKRMSSPFVPFEAEPSMTDNYVELRRR